MGLPYVAHFYGHDASRYKILKEYASRYLKLFKYSSAIICASLEMKKRLIDLEVPEEKIHNIPDGVDLKIFQPTVSKDSIPLFYL